MGEGVSGAPVIEVRQRVTDTVEVEKKAAQIRAGKTLEERQRQFKEMLLEREVRVSVLYLEYKVNEGDGYVCTDIYTWLTCNLFSPFLSLSLPSFSLNYPGFSFLHLGEGAT